jgi:NitT/TauT family transport system permease protein
VSQGSQPGRVSLWGRGLAGIAGFLILAEVLGRTGIISPAVLPLASTVLARTAGLAADPRFLTDLAATLEAWALGLAIAIAVAVPCGVVLGSLPVVRTATRAVVEFLRPIPSVALILFVGLLIGPGLRMNVTLIVYAAVWPVLFNTMYGLDDTDPVAKETLRAFGFGRPAVIRSSRPGSGSPPPSPSSSTSAPDSSPAGSAGTASAPS